MSDSPLPDSDRTAAATPDQLKRSAELSVYTDVAPKIVADRYELQDFLAKGGMGAVYKAWDKVFSRHVAVKLLREGRLEPSILKRFQHEALITGQLQHPSIPPIYDLGTTPDQRPYLAMKLVKGRTLDDHIKRPGDDTPNLIAVFEGICQAIGYAHNKGVLHRDLKPLNVMVGAFGEVQVMDWGLAKFRQEVEESSPETSIASTFYDPRTANDSRTSAGSVIGTPSYMPPEQAIGAIGEITERSDVFGLGAILCAILTKQPVFVGADSESTRQMAAKGKVGDAFARLDASGAEPELVALTKRCLASEPNERLANGDEVAREVARIRVEADARALQAEVRRERTLVQADEHRKRRRMQFLLLSGILFVSLAGTGASLRYSDIAYDRRIEAENAQRQSKKDEDAALEARSIAQKEKADADRARENADVARKNAEWAAYISQISLSHREWELQNAPAAFSILNSTTKSYRGWEYKYLSNLYTRERNWTVNQYGVAESMTLHPNTSRIAVGGDRNLSIWDTVTGKLIYRVNIERQIALRTIAYSLDGKIIVAGEGYNDKVSPMRIMKWNATTGEQIKSNIVVRGAVNNICFLDDSRIVVSCHSSRLYWININTDTIEQTLDINNQYSGVAMAISPDRKYLAVGGGASPIQLRSASDGNLVKVFDNQSPNRLNQYRIDDLAFSSDGTRVAGGGVGICAWDVASANTIFARRLENILQIRRVAWLPGGKSLFAAAENRAIIQVDTTTGMEVRRFLGHIGGVNGIAVSNNAMYSCGSDSRVISWRTIIQSDPIIYSDQVQQHAWFNDLEFSKDGRKIFAADGYSGSLAHGWDYTTSAILTKFRGHTNGVVSITTSHDSKHVFTGSGDRTVRMWEMANGRQLMLFKGHKDVVNGLACDPVGNWLASSSRDGTLLIWDTKSAKIIRILIDTSAPILSVTAHDRLLAAGLSDGTIVLWNTDTWNEIARLRRNSSFAKDHALNKLSIAFTPDGSNLVSCGSDRWLAVWDLKRRTVLWSKQIATTPINDLAVLPEGTQFVTAMGAWGEPGEVKVWNTITGENTFTLRGLNRECTAVAVNPVDQSIAACSHEGLICLWGQDANSLLKGLEYRKRSEESRGIFAKGKALLEQGNIDGAIAAYRQAIQLDPKDASKHNRLGSVLKTMGDLDGAIIAYREATQLDPSNADHHNGLGLVLKAKGDLDGAIAAYLEGIRQNPMHIYAYSNLETALNAKGDFPGAIAAYREAIRLDPNAPQFRISLGFALEHLGDPFGAMAEFEEAIRLQPGNARAQNNLSWLRSTGPDGVRDAKKAHLHGKLACELTGWKNPIYIDTLAAAYAELGNFDKAIELQTKALEFPDYEKLYGDEGRKKIEQFKRKVPFRDPDLVLKFLEPAPPPRQAKPR